MSAKFKKQLEGDARQFRLENVATAINISVVAQATPGPPPEATPETPPEVPAPTPTTVPPPDHSPDPNSAPQPHAVRKRVVVGGNPPRITSHSVIIANSNSPYRKDI